MSALDCTSSRLRASRAGGLLSGIGAFFSRFRSRREARIGIGHLKSLSDWQLRDIGMDRRQVMSIACGIRAPSSRHGHAEH